MASNGGVRGGAWHAHAARQRSGHRCLVVLFAALMTLPTLARAGGDDSDAPRAEWEVRLLAVGSRIEGRGTLHFPSRESTVWTLGRGFEWERVAADGATVQQNGQRLQVQPDRSDARVRLRWSGRVRDDQYARFNDDGVYLPRGAGWVPRPGVGRVRWTLSVEPPDGMEAVASGTRVTKPGERPARFRHDAPSPGITLVAGPWRARSQDARHGTVWTYFPEPLADLEDRYLTRTAEYLDEYAEWIGPPAYETYSVVAAPVPVGFAYPAFTWIGEDVLRLPFIPETSLPHEVVHGWWGTVVESRRDDGNWSEALTTWMADYHQRRVHEGEGDRAGGATRMRGDWLRDQHALGSDSDYALREFQQVGGPADRIVGYQRGAFLFELIQQELGEDAMTAAIRSLYQAHRHHAIGWDEVLAPFRAEARDSGRLDALIDAMLHRPGAPEVRLRVDDVEVDSDGTWVRGALRMAADGYPGRAPLVITTHDGQERFSVALQPGKWVSFEHRVAGQAQALRVDPEHRLYRALDQDEATATLRMALLRDDPIIRQGHPDALSDALAALGVPSELQRPPADGERVAWAARSPEAGVILAVSDTGRDPADGVTDDPRQQSGLLQRIGRYGAEGYVVFSGSGRPKARGLHPEPGAHALRRLLPPED